MKSNFFLSALLILILLTGCAESSQLDKEDYRSWSSYLGDSKRSHFTVLDEISPENVTQLQLAWEYEAPDAGQMQMNPLIVDSLVFGVSAALRAFALDARTGEEVWVFGDSLKVWHSTSRGVSYWKEGEDERIFYTVGSDLWALNARTGKPIATFGQGGKIDLRSGMPDFARELFVISNTPGTIYKDLIIMPIRLSESAGAAPGDVMAFNVRSGVPEWVFHTIPYPGELGYDTWSDPDTYKNTTVGAANNWAGMALDEAREILYVPTGSAAPDFYGADRLGSNLFSNSLLALNANTGELIWHFQFTHHDIWDRDLPAPPNLLTVTHDGKRIAAVSQTTKQGYVYLFDRVSGAPLFEIEERSVPNSKLLGEQAWPTQPFPVKPAPFARQSSEFGPENISPYAPDADSLRQVLVSSKKDIYSPPGLDPVFLLPGYDGAAEWGGAGASPEEGILYVNSNEMAWILQMEETPDFKELRNPGARIYASNCALCHQKDRSGRSQSGYPSLLGLSERLNPEEALQTIVQGKGMMTGFPQLSEQQLQHLIAFLYEQDADKQEVTSSEEDSGFSHPYRHMGYNKFLDANGLPGIDPPWGTLHAIDLNTGEYLWSKTLGDTPELKAAGHPPTGSENYGGPIVTENGLLFIAGTKDGVFRAFNRHNGTLLWEYQLPAAAFATPATYEIDGKQYIVIACGGEKLGSQKGNKILAFSL